MTLEDDGKASMVFLKNSHAMGTNSNILSVHEFANVLIKFTHTNDK